MYSLETFLVASYTKFYFEKKKLLLKNKLISSQMDRNGQLHRKPFLQTSRQLKRNGCAKKAKHCSTKFFTFIRVFLWTTITTKQFFSLMNNFRVGFQTQNAFIGFTTWITFKLFSLMNNLSMSFQTCYSIVAFSARITFKRFVFIVLFNIFLFYDFLICNFLLLKLTFTLISMTSVWGHQFCVCIIRMTFA